jgi:ABC-type nitrate/sulfonate/bicarbonate transport system, ATPase component
MSVPPFPGHLSVGHARKVYPTRHGDVVAVDDCSIDVPPGQFCAIVGPSGCGKTTLMNAVAGFDTLSGGEIRLDGRIVNGPGRKPVPGPDRLVVFQHGALFPWATVRENLIRGPVVRGLMSAAEAEKQAGALLGRVGLRDVFDSYPGALSSGMARRVEIVRALLNEPSVILLDEPFRGLDTASKAATHDCLLDLYESRPRTVLLITHDLDEALFLADRVVVMTTRPGRVKVELEVDLPRPRGRHLLTAPEFLGLKARLIEAVHEEAVKAFAAGERELA